MSVATVVHSVVPTIGEMIAELLRSGTIMGYATLAKIHKAKIGLILFAQDEHIDPDGRLRKLGGISHSMGITFEELTQRKHNELVVNLHRCVTGHPAIASHALEESTLLAEIRGWTP